VRGGPSIKVHRGDPVVEQEMLPLPSSGILKPLYDGGSSGAIPKIKKSSVTFDIPPEVILPQSKLVNSPGLPTGLENANIENFV
jgi:hypothetical protein